MNKISVLAGVLALVGLIVNVVADLDNVYDMTTTILWVLTLIVAFAGAFMGSKKQQATSASVPSGTPQGTTP